MKILRIISGVVSLVLVTTNVNAATKSEHYIFRYETGDTYEVQFTDKSLTWTGLEGSDTGQTETDAIKRKKLSNTIDVVQWHEKSGTFVTLVFDKANLRIMSSGKTQNGDWLNYGVAENKLSLEGE